MSFESLTVFTRRGSGSGGAGGWAASGRRAGGAGARSRRRGRGDRLRRLGRQRGVRACPQDRSPGSNPWRSRFAALRPVRRPRRGRSGVDRAAGCPQCQTLDRTGAATSPVVRPRRHPRKDTAARAPGRRDDGGGVTPLHRGAPPAARRRLLRRSLHRARWAPRDQRPGQIVCIRGAPASPRQRSAP